MSRRPSKENALAEKAEVALHVDTEEGQDLDARIQQLAREAPPFYKNGNLWKLYLLMIPGCLVPSLTLGFDSAMMNGLQAVATWQECERALPVYP